jgi:hypothetical protein
MYKSTLGESRLWPPPPTVASLSSSFVGKLFLGRPIIQNSFKSREQRIGVCTREKLFTSKQQRQRPRFFYANWFQLSTPFRLNALLKNGGKIMYFEMTFWAGRFLQRNT